MDIPQVLAALRPDDDWGPCASDSTYADLAKMWRGKSPVPTEEEMRGTWADLKAANEARDAEAKSQAAEVLAALAAYKAIANPTANQRLAFERRVCDVLTTVLKRMTQRD